MTDADNLYGLVAHCVCMGIPPDVILSRCDEDDRDRAVAIHRSLTDRAQAIPPGYDTLALIGDYPHDPSYIRPILEQVLAEACMRTQFLHDVSLFDAEALAGAKLLVVLRDCMLWPEPGGEPVFWMTEEQERAIAGFVSAGGGLLALHNSTALRCIDESRTLYRDVLGSSYTGHGSADEAFTVTVVNRDHPVTEGVSDYPAIDERHWPVVYADDAEILTRAVSGDETSVNGYARAYGDGRVCYLANGHTSEILGCDSMRRLISNGAEWCTGRR